MLFSNHAATTAYAEITAYAVAVSAHADSVTSHMCPFDPTSTAHEKMPKTFFERVLVTSDQKIFLNFFSQCAKRRDYFPSGARQLKQMKYFPSGVKFSERSEKNR